MCLICNPFVLFSQQGREYFLWNLFGNLKKHQSALVICNINIILHLYRSNHMREEESNESEREMCGVFKTLTH